MNKGTYLSCRKFIQNAASAIFTFSILAGSITAHALQLSDVQGDWKGAIMSAAGSSNYNLGVSISGQSNQISGMTQYSDLVCKGELKLSSKDNSTLVFKESITEGEGNCLNGAIITISKNASQGLTYTWHYPSGKAGLQAELVSGLASTPSGAVASTATAQGRPPAPHAKVGAGVVHSDREAEKKLALRYLEDVAAHPDDPENPPGVVGVSDAELENVPFNEIQELFEISLSYAEAETNEPRYLFALGRAAYLHGDEEYAEELLTEAASRGSAAAEGYLAKLTNDDDLESTAGHLRRAVRGGFRPAKAWLVEVEAAIDEEQAAQQRQVAKKTSPAPAFDPSRFSRPDMIRAFYNENKAEAKGTPLEQLTYIQSFQQFLEDQSQVLFVTSDPLILTEIEPGLSIRIQRKLSSDSVRNEAINKGFQSSPLGIIFQIAKARQSGATIEQEAQVMFDGALNNPVTDLQIIRDQAAKDAAILAAHYDSQPELFRRVYGGFKKFAYAF